jgi:hypothetical protein
MGMADVDVHDDDVAADPEHRMPGWPEILADF